MAYRNGDTDFGRLLAPDTVRIERVLPGPRERVWRYLTEPDLRRQWLAAGDFDLRSGGDAHLVFRNNELTKDDDPPPPSHAEFGKEMQLSGVILVCDPPTTLAYTWGTNPDASEVRFDLSDEGDRVRLVVTHSRASSRTMLKNILAGWHTHLDLLVSILEDQAPDGFWRRFAANVAHYDAVIPPG
jgi:uncharacterized protein YndB with AHSA1/START domain